MNIPLNFRFILIFSERYHHAVPLVRLPVAFDVPVALRSPHHPGDRRGRESHDAAANGPPLLCVGILLPSTSGSHVFFSECTSALPNSYLAACPSLSAALTT